MYMRILPMYFSHSTLHDTEVEKVLEILTFLRLSPSFAKEDGMFDQWYQIFKRRTVSKKFTYKDESCVRNLPVVKDSGSVFANCIGYVDVHLFRNFHRWLRLLRLHKYLFLFSNMSYKQIMGLNEETFEELEKDLNIVQVTAGAKAKILREVDRLRQRRQHLEEIFKMPLTNSITELEDVIRDLKRILRTPIPLEDVFYENLPQWIVRCLHKVFQIIVTSPNFDQFLEVIYGLFISLLKEAWNYNIFSIEEKNSFNEWRTTLSNQLLERRNVETGEVLKHAECGRDRSSLFTVKQETEPSDLFPIESWDNNTSVTGFENMIHVFSNLSMIDVFSYLNTKDPPPHPDRRPVPSRFVNDQYVAPEEVFLHGTSYPWE